MCSFLSIYFGRKGVIEIQKLCTCCLKLVFFAYVCNNTGIMCFQFMEIRVGKRNLSHISRQNIKKQIKISIR